PARAWQWAEIAALLGPLRGTDRPAPVVLLGGRGDAGRFGDLWALDLNLEAALAGQVEPALSWGGPERAAAALAPAKTGAGLLGVSRGEFCAAAGSAAGESAWTAGCMD
ncbi:unnamed protein product, partial [Phaeothamnion confervicola]